MLSKEMIQKIQDMKAAGYSIREVIDHLAGIPSSPTEPTIRKYYKLDGVPDDLGASLKKSLAFDQEPFRSTVIEILERNPHALLSSVYDVLEERFVESGRYDSLPGNAQTLRNYVGRLRESGAVAIGQQERRTYDVIDGLAPGQQLLVDFAQHRVSSGLVVHFICLLLRFSRLLGVYAQDHAFNATEACRAIYRFFAKAGGRPEEVVIDQDSVFVGSEALGEVVSTQVFGAFVAEQGLRLWVCNKNDPESKGPIENTVGFVKKNYFSARALGSIEEVQNTLPGWVDRKNRRIHQATCLVPLEVFTQVERDRLRPLLPSVYETAPLDLTRRDVKSQPFINYLSSRYSVPWEHCYSTVYFRAMAGMLYIYDANRRFICAHCLSPAKGSVNRLPEHEREPSAEWMAVAERLRGKYNCVKLQHFINGFRKENGRHTAKQLSAVERLLDAERPPMELIARVLEACCEDYRYRFSQFEAVYRLEKARLAIPGPVEPSDVQKRDLGSYQAEFERRAAL